MPQPAVLHSKVKRFKARRSDHQLEDFLNELSISDFLRRNADCCVPLLDALRTDSESLLVYRKVGTDLRAYIKSQAGATMSGNLCRELATNIFQALSKLEELQVIHADIKPANMLVNIQDGALVQFYLCDFGLARFVARPVASAVGADKLVSLNYRSLELLLGHGVQDFKLDAWAAGCACYEIASGSTLPFFAGTAKKEVVSAILQQRGCPTEEQQLDFFNTATLPQWKSMSHTNYQAQPLDEMWGKLGAGLELWQRVFALHPKDRPPASEVLRRLTFFRLAHGAYVTYRGNLFPSPSLPLIVDPEAPTEGPIVFANPSTGNRIQVGERGLAVMLYGKLPADLTAFLGADEFLGKPADELEALGLQDWEMQARSPDAPRQLRASLERQCRGDRGLKIQLAGHLCEGAPAGGAVNGLRVNRSLPVRRFVSFRQAWFGKHREKWLLLERNLKKCMADHEDQSSANVRAFRDLDAETAFLAAGSLHLMMGYAPFRQTSRATTPRCCSALWLFQPAIRCLRLCPQAWYFGWRICMARLRSAQRIQILNL